MLVFIKSENTLFQLFFFSLMSELCQKYQSVYSGTAKAPYEGDRGEKTIVR
jgi:hypothetical protein